MNISFLFTIIYVLSTLALCSGFFLMKKSQDTFYVATWLPVTMIGLMGYQTFVAAIMGLVNIPINILSIAITNLILAFFIWAYIVKKREIQKYVIEKIDVTIFLLMLLGVVLIALKRYSYALYPNFCSIDASVHFTYAMNFVNSGSVNTMFFSSLHSGLLIECLAPFMMPTFYFRIFVLGEVLYFLLAGVMFWGMIRRYCCGNFIKFAGIFTTGIFMVGYTLNSTLFGFSYMGLGVTVIGFIIAVTDIYTNDEINDKLSIVLLSFGCLSLFQSYVLYMPVVFFALCTCMLVKQYQKKKFISMETIWTGLGIFLIPTILGLKYVYNGFFGNAKTGGTSIASAIDNEGGVYADLISNFVLLIPLGFFAWWMLYKKKKNNLILYLLPMEILFVVGMFCGALTRKVSAYYVYKNYYVLWLLFMFLAFIAVVYMEKQARILITYIVAVWFVIAAAGVLKVNQRLKEVSPLLNQRITIEVVGDIFVFNRDFLGTPPQSAFKFDLYRYVNEELLDKNVTDTVMVASSFEDQYWFDAITNQRYWKRPSTEMQAIVDEKMAQYVVVISGCMEYENYIDVFSSYEKIYENQAGYIVKIY